MIGRETLIELTNLVISSLDLFTSVQSSDSVSIYKARNAENDVKTVVEAYLALMVTEYNRRPGASCSHLVVTPLHNSEMVVSQVNGTNSRHGNQL
jgi:hypothetical protein